ncbi:methyltransferase domain-containing protein [Colletotrichum salicis]|uniref:Methyltransferase domain-containing protein n=1 Tax=Colletotrichum salicis TaxID=1209931 RepID=A0A135UKU0_9PEZI|nr:methyltransferase domain-containing protein [Colletotrichum salicis]
MQAPNVAAVADATPANEIAATVDADNHDEGIDADGDESSHADTESVLTTSTSSVSESITDYRRIHGRTFSQKTDYWGPNDEKQNEALDLVIITDDDNVFTKSHNWELQFFDDKLFLAPLGDSPQKVLDLGTGTGIWAIDFADEFPSAQVTGIDISPIQPGWVPPDCKFQVDDIEQPWTWSEDFDFIHISHLEASIADWPALYKQAFGHLIPGGYIEVKEFDITTRSQLHGDDIPKDHCRIEIMGWEYAEIIVFVAEMRKALKDPKLQAYFHLHVFYARKPEEQEGTQAET